MISSAKHSFKKPTQRFDKQFFDRVQLNGEASQDVETWLQAGRRSRDARNYTNASSCFSEAFRIANAHLGKKHKATTNALFYFAHAQLKAGRLKEAENNFFELVTILKQVHGNTHREVAHAWHWLGYTQLASLKYEKSVASFSQKLHIKHSLYGSFHSEVADAWFTLGDCYLKWKNYEKAANCFYQEIKSQQPIFSHELLCAWWDYIEALISGCYFRRAEKEILHLLELLQRQGSDEDIAYGLYWLGFAQAKNKRLVEANESLEEAIKIWNENNVKSERVIKSLVLLGRVQEKLHLHTEAEKSFTRAINMFDSLCFEFNDDYIVSLYRLGRIKFKTGEYQQSQKLFESVLNNKMVDITSESNSTTRANTWFWLGRVKYKACKYIEAEACLTKSLEILPRSHRATQSNMARNLHWLGLSQLHNGRFNDAENCLLKSLQIIESLYENNHTKTSAAWYWLGRTQYLLNNFSQSEQSLSETLRINSYKKRKPNKETALTLYWIGRNKLKTEQRSEAEQIFLRSLEIFRSQKSISKKYIADCLYWTGFTKSKNEGTVAKQLLLESLQIKQDLGSYDEQLADIHYLLGHMQTADCRHTEAAIHFLRSLNIRTFFCGDRHETIATTNFCLARSEYEDRNFTEAEIHFRKSLTLRKNTDSSFEDIAKNWYWLGRTQCESGKYTEAEKSLLEAVKTQGFINQTCSESSIDIAYWLGYTQFLADKHSHAESTFTELLKDLDKNTDLQKQDSVLQHLILMARDEEKDKTLKLQQDLFDVRKKMYDPSDPESMQRLEEIANALKNRNQT